MHHEQAHAVEDASHYCFCSKHSPFWRFQSMSCLVSFREDDLGPRVIIRRGKRRLVFPETQCFGARRRSARADRLSPRVRLHRCRGTRLTRGKIKQSARSTTTGVEGRIHVDVERKAPQRWSATGKRSTGNDATARCVGPIGLERRSGNAYNVSIAMLGVEGAQTRIGNHSIFSERKLHRLT